MTMEESRSPRLLVAWLGLCLAVAAHVADEALTGFLSVYNPTILALRESIPWLPFPVFRFDVWLTGLIVGILLLLSLSPLLHAGATWMRPIAYALAVLMLANGALHTLGTIFGRTVESVRFARPMPGFYSSPLLIAASMFLLVELRRAARKTA